METDAFGGNFSHFLTLSSRYIVPEFFHLCALFIRNCFTSLFRDSPSESIECWMKCVINSSLCLDGCERGLSLPKMLSRPSAVSPKFIHISTLSSFHVCSCLYIRVLYLVLYTSWFCWIALFSIHSTKNITSETKRETNAFITRVQEKVNTGSSF